MPLVSSDALVSSFLVPRHPTSVPAPLVCQDSRDAGEPVSRAAGATGGHSETCRFEAMLS